MKLNKQGSLLLLGSSALIGIVTDILTRQDIFGLNFLLWSLIWFGIISVQLFKRNKLNYRTCVYVGFALVNAYMVYIRAEPVVQVWSVFSTLSFLALLFGATYLDNYFELPLMKRFFEYVGGSVMSTVQIIGVITRSLGVKATEKPIKARATVGIGIAFILGLIFIGLFSSSDQVFRSNFSWLGNALTSLGDWLGSFNIGRIITVGFWIAVALGWLSMVLSRNKIDDISDIKLAKLISKKDAQIILGVISAIFVLFVFVQVRFLFGKAVLPDGISYADYARSGYGQLLFATILASGVVYITRNIVKDSASKSIKWISTALLVLNALVVLSAWERLSLYESAYGWTMTRFIARMGLVCIMAGIVYLLVWVSGRLSNKEVFSASWYTLATVLLVSAIINPIGLITKRNIVDLPKREVALDVYHILNQSADSYPSICTYAPFLKEKYPAEYTSLINRSLPLSESGYYAYYQYQNVVLQANDNEGLSGHFVNTKAFRSKTVCFSK